MTGNCDMCGIESNLKQAIVEGSMMDLCGKCASYGDVISVNKPKISNSFDKPSVPRDIYVEEKVDFVVEGAGKIIKNERENKDLQQSQLASMVGVKESVIHKIETSMLKPELSIAKKLEKILDVKIIEDYKDSENKVQLKLNDENLTIGDLIEFKK